MVGEPKKKKRKVAPADGVDTSTLKTPISQVKRSKTADPDESGTKTKKGAAPPVVTKTAQKAKPKKPVEKTPQPPKAEVNPPDDETAKAVKSAINRKGTDEMCNADPPEDSDDSGDDDDNDDGDDDEDQTDAQAEQVRLKRAAHARFMRFSRSLKSFLTILSTHFLEYHLDKKNVLIFLEWIDRSYLDCI